MTTIIKAYRGIAVWRSPWPWLALLLLVIGVACDGDTFRIHLVNDTEQQLEYRMCRSTNCDSPRTSSLVDPGDSLAVTGVVGVPNWWQVRDTAGNVQGCFSLLYDERPVFDERPDLDLTTADLEACP